MLPSYLNLNIQKTKVYINKILVGNANKAGKKLPATPPDVSKAVIPAAWHDPVETAKLHNLKMLTEKHNDEKLAVTLLIVVAGLIPYHFW